MTEKLPGVLAEIADVAGEAAAFSIASAKGGTRIYVPARIDADHWLVETVGLAAAQKICKHFAVDHVRGQDIEIPLYVGGTFRQLLRKVAQRVHELDQDDDASESSIARILGITGRTVRRHRARHRGKRDKRQGRLF